MQMWILQVFLVLLTRLSTINSMEDKNQGICDDFYRYTCADWTQNRTIPSSEPFWNVYTETAHAISETLQSILDSDNFTAIDNEKTFYKSCIQPSDYLKEFRYFVDKLGGIQRTLHRNKRYDYFMHTIDVSKLLNIHPIFNFHESNNVLHIVHGDFVFPTLLLTHSENFTKELNIYKIWVEKVLSILYPDELSFFATIMRGRRDFVNNTVVAKEIVDLEVSIAKLPHGKHIRIPTEKFKHHLALKFLYETSLDEVNNAIPQEIIIDEIYFEALMRLFSTTHWRQVSNYIVWAAVKELSRDVNINFRKLSFEVDRQLIGVSSDIARERECVDQTIDYIGHQGLQKSFELYKKQDHKRIVAYVTEIAENIRNVFISWAEDAKGLSKKYRDMIIKKIASVKLEILSPQMSDQLVVPILGYNHLENVIKLRSTKFQRELRESINGSIQWPKNIFDVNAFYSPHQNAIILPLGILQAPFFDYQQSYAFNYGALGSLIGHELSHIFDNFNMRESSKYDFRLHRYPGQCLEDIFDQTNTDSAAMNELIADYIGMQLSYFAMQNKLLNEVIAEDSNELFFLKYSTMWCELSQDQNTFLAQDVHAPVALRVMKTLENFPQFLQTYHCMSKQHSCAKV